MTSLRTTKDDFTEGQEVLVVTPPYVRGETRYERATVIKVARKYLTVEIPERKWQNHKEFSIETRKVRNNGNHTYRLPYIETPETFWEGDRERQARKVWDEHQIGFKNYSRGDLAVEQYEAIAQILDPTWVPRLDPPETIDEVLALIEERVGS